MSLADAWYRFEEIAPRWSNLPPPPQFPQVFSRVLCFQRLQPPLPLFRRKGNEKNPWYFSTVPKSD